MPHILFFSCFSSSYTHKHDATNESRVMREWGKRVCDTYRTNTMSSTSCLSSKPPQLPLRRRLQTYCLFHTSKNCMWVIRKPKHHIKTNTHHQQYLKQCLNHEDRRMQHCSYHLSLNPSNLKKKASRSDRTVQTCLTFFCFRAFCRRTHKHDATNESRVMRE